jgi:hypothetical protein
VLKIKAFTITINAINIMPMKSGTVSTSSLPLQFILRHSTWVFIVNTNSYPV